MSDARMAVDAVKNLIIVNDAWMAGAICEVVVAVKTGFVGDVEAYLACHDVLRVPSGGELQGVHKPVLRLHVVLVNDIVVRQMAVTAGGEIVVGAGQPGIVFVFHDVAVDACGWV